MAHDKLTRRVALQSAAILGVGAPLLAACSSETASEEGAGASTGSPTAEESITDASGADAFASTKDIPVGGGKVFSDDQIVIVQPTAGEFKAYSAVCPHQSCIFSEVADNAIKCGSCHRSEFSSQDGSNTVGANGGPANLPALEQRALSVDGDSISLA